MLVEDGRVSFLLFAMIPDTIVVNGFKGFILEGWAVSHPNQSACESWVSSAKCWHSCESTAVQREAADCW